MNNDIKEILIKDFNEILVKEFCTDWKEKRLYIELLVNSTPFSNLLDYITNLQQELEEYKDTETYSKRFLYKANKDRLNANLELVKELENYKSRIEKAVEYIKENAWYMNKDDEEILDRVGIEGLLKILEGSNNE